MLWGGPSWKKILKLNHGGVKLLNCDPPPSHTHTPQPNRDATAS